MMSTVRPRQNAGDQCYSLYEPDMSIVLPSLYLSAIADLTRSDPSITVTGTSEELEKKLLKLTSSGPLRLVFV